VPMMLKVVAVLCAFFYRNSVDIFCNISFLEVHFGHMNIITAIAPENLLISDVYIHF